MVITTNNGGANSIEVYPDDASTHYCNIDNEDYVTLKFSMPRYFSFNVGATIVWKGETFTLFDPADVKKEGKDLFQYTLTLYSAMKYLDCFKVVYLDERMPTAEYKMRFGLNLTPSEYMEFLQGVMNEKQSGWTFSVDDSVYDAEERVYRNWEAMGEQRMVEFDHTTVREALDKVAEAFSCEWYFVGGQRMVRLGRRGNQGIQNGVASLCYGQGQGFVPGLGRKTETDDRPITRLYVQGGERNIDYTSYGSHTLRLPKLQRNTVYIGDLMYQTDEDGLALALRPSNAPSVKMLSMPYEESLDLSDVFPMWEGEVTAAEYDSGRKAWSFCCSSVPYDLDFNDFYIDGEEHYIIFQTGMLAGDGQFKFEYRHSYHPNESTTKSRIFWLESQEIDGFMMPSQEADGSFLPRIGDKFAVFGIRLPEKYITEAEQRMMEKAKDYLREHVTPKFTFSGVVQSLWYKQHPIEASLLKLGNYIDFRDEDIQSEPVRLRIVGVKTPLTNPEAPTIEISNSVGAQSATVASELKKLKEDTVVSREERDKILRFAKRGFRDSAEAVEMLVSATESLSGRFSEEVSPIAVRTMMALIGDESLQFAFVESKANRSVVPCPVYYDAESGRMRCDEACALMHYTVGQGITASRTADSYKAWDLNGGWVSDALGGGKYYLYAVCDPLYESGFYYMSETALPLRTEERGWNFLLGVLNSDFGGGRSFCPMYGFTEIAPGRITADRIVSADGESYFDLVANQFKLGDKLSFNKNGDGALVLKGSLVQNRDGSESALPCFRGTYNDSTTYYPGDEVTYAGEGGCVSTYRLKYNAGFESAQGKLPTREYYWELVSQGSKGDSSPFLVCRGEYDPEAVYIGTKERVDCVRYEDSDGRLAWYVARTDNGGSFQGELPTDCTRWNMFGATFESVATGLLLAENANIAGWIFSNQKVLDADMPLLKSQSTYRVSKNDYDPYKGHTDDGYYYMPVSWMNGATGEMSLGRGNFKVDGEGTVVIKGQAELNKATINDAKYMGNITMQGVIMYNVANITIQYETDRYAHFYQVKDSDRAVIIFGSVPGHKGLDITTVRLPKNPKYGTFYDIINLSTSEVYIDPNGRDCYSKRRRTDGTIHIDKGYMVLPKTAHLLYYGYWYDITYE